MDKIRIQKALDRYHEITFSVFPSMLDYNKCVEEFNLTDEEASHFARAIVAKLDDNRPKPEERSVFIIKNFGKHSARIERVCSTGAVDFLCVLKPNEEKTINSVKGVRAAPVSGPVDVKFLEQHIAQVGENPFDTETCTAK